MNNQRLAAVAFRDLVEVYDVVLHFADLNRGLAEKMAEKAVAAENFVGSPSIDNTLVNSGRRG